MFCRNLKFIIFVGFSFCMEIQAAIYNGLDFGVPSHSLGYADNDGYVLYTKFLFDLNLADVDASKEMPVKIPIRIIFSTNEKQRKGFLLDKFWTFSIFDSSIVKTDKFKYFWISPDLNLVIFRKNQKNGFWNTDGGTIFLRENKNGTLTIYSTDNRCAEVGLEYKNGRLSEIKIKRNNVINRFSVYRTKNILVVRNSESKEIFRIEKHTDKTKKTKIDITSNGALFSFHTKEFQNMVPNGFESANLISQIKTSDDILDFDYSFTNEYSKMSFDKNKFIEWNSASGEIRKDSFSDYLVNKSKNEIVEISRSFPWGRYSYKIFNRNAITQASSDRYKIETYGVSGIPRLFGVNRKHIIYDKTTNNRLGLFQNIFDENGNIVRTINERY